MAFLAGRLDTEDAGQEDEIHGRRGEQGAESRRDVELEPSRWYELTVEKRSE